MNNLTSLKFFKGEPFLLLGIAAGLQATCITLVWRAEDTGFLGMSILFLLATASLLWDKRHKLTFGSGVVPSTVGIVLISWVLWRNAHLQVDGNIHLLSFVSALGVALLAAGFRGLRQYWEELLILFFLGVPNVIVRYFLDISPWTAKFAAFLLWYGGFDAVVNGTIIHLPKGSIDVAYRCSGIDSIMYMMGISVIALVMFPIAKGKRLPMVAFAIILGFVINAVRVAMLAIMSGTNQRAFENWHGGKASYSFAMVGILIFGAVYIFVLWQEERELKNPPKSENQTPKSLIRTEK